MFRHPKRQRRWKVYLAGVVSLIDVIYFPPPPRKGRDFLNLRTQIRATKSRTLIYIADRDVLSTLRDICFFRSCGIRQVIGAPLKRDLRVPRVDPANPAIPKERRRDWRAVWRRLERLIWKTADFGICACNQTKSVLATERWHRSETVISLPSTPVERFQARIGGTKTGLFCFD